MKKTCFSGVWALLLLLSASLFWAGCVNEDYDLSKDNLNLEVTPLGEGVVIPLGATDPITLGDILAGSNFEVLKVGPAGEYYVGFGDSFDMSQELSGLKDIITIPDLRFSQSVDFAFVDDNPGDDVYHASIVKDVDFVVMEAYDVPKEVISVNEIIFDNAAVYIGLDNSALPSLGSADLSINLKVHFPPMVKAEGADENGLLNIPVIVREDGTLIVNPINILSLDLSGMDLKDGIRGTARVEGEATLSGLPENLNEWLNTGLKIGYYIHCQDIGISRMTGKVDYRLEPYVTEVELAEVTDFLGDTGAEITLDFCRACLNLEAVTNLGIPVIADLKLVPYYDGVADESLALAANVALNPSESAGITETTKYEFPEADVLRMLDRIPEKLDVQVDAYTDTERESLLEPKADYSLVTDYAFELPLEFGEKFEVMYRDTIPDMPEIVGELLAMGNKVMIIGEIENSFPVGLELQLNLLDPQNGIVKMAEGCGIQKISPCNPDGTASVTEVALAVGMGDLNGAEPRVASLELVFRADSKEAVGVPVTEDCYVQAELQLSAPEGVTVDLKDFINNENR